MEHRNTSATVRAVLQVCTDGGVEIDTLLALAGMTSDDVSDVDGEVTRSQMQAFWQHAYRLSGDPYLAMHAGQDVAVGAYKCIDYFFVSAPTFGVGLERVIRYFGLINTWITLEVVPGQEDTTVRMRGAAGPLPKPPIEYTWTVFTERARLRFDPEWSPKRIRFPFAQLPDLSKHRAYFRCPVDYEAPAAEFVISADCWSRSLPDGDDMLFRLIDEHARLLLQQRLLPDDLIGEVRQAIVRELHGGDPRRGAVAKRLGMSTRTLQRRLSEHGVAYSDLLDEIRVEFAKTHLQGSELALCEIGYLLGFAEQSSFTRAFKRWTGQTPLEYRQALGRTAQASEALE